ncbi:RNA polymerase sigma-70 factor (ECF subfamily) [Bacillus mesophilus]|uniref:Sigma-70 family RNA polymerase sigma factor n=1 Tax=Bacillus mesophilus TaxID=1808955 RepID=A0A6M0QA06_9BACI|nr:sigma-70 family RNA polymerase sigma factor [Bacillus mesophilus]MBM7662735.1 RNA polymerase sigma-70 factor (ECF subfamily) [Bacillus mesophilus]NEY73204.1 sigma-70 family RNA polymerase sigma factor [Bacillus mesophilus]
MLKLVKKAQQGDDQAFLKLFQQYEEDIYRMAYVYVKNEGDALDVVQEVAYRSFKKIGTLQKPEYFKSWLVKIAITCSIDLIKKNNKVVQLNPEFEEYIGVEDQDVSLSITLHEVMNQLNAEEKSIVLLKYYEGYSFKEISNSLEMPLGTTKSILYRALGKLRTKLKEAEIQ